MAFPVPILRTIVAVLAFGCWASPALADPCEGALPAKGTDFNGIVRYVGDGDSLCVGPAGRPDRWIEVRLGDYYARELHEKGGREAKRRLERLVFGQVLNCRAGKRSYDRVIATCTLRGRPVGQLLRAQGAAGGGRGWKR